MVKYHVTKSCHSSLVCPIVTHLSPYILLVSDILKCYSPFYSRFSQEGSFLQVLQVELDLSFSSSRFPLTCLVLLILSNLLIITVYLWTVPTVHCSTVTQLRIVAVCKSLGTGTQSQSLTVVTRGLHCYEGMAPLPAFPSKTGAFLCKPLFTATAKTFC